MDPKIGFLLNQSFEALRGSNLDSAKLYLTQIVKLEPQNPHALRLLGVLAAQRKDYQEAIDYINASLKSLPRNSIALSNLGNIFLELKKYEEALDAYDKSIKLEPTYEEAWSNKGNVLFELMRYEDALAHHNQALRLKSDYAEAWLNKANTLHKLKRHEEAIAHYDKALSLNPNFVEAYLNKGNIFHELKYYEEAIAHYDKALSLNPNFVEAWSNKGVSHYDLKNYEEAIAHYDKALSLNPKINWLFGDFIFTKLKVCDWTNFNEYSIRLIDQIKSGQKIARPFVGIALSDNALIHLESSKTYAENKCLFNPILGKIPKHTNQKKIRLGYFSADFHNHATGYLMAELFELHNRSRFELIGFSFGPTQDDQMQQRLRKSFDRFIEVGNKSDIEIAQLSRDYNIDIAIDLKGYTQDSRPEIFSYRAAPIQVNYLGFPGTMGSTCIDYIIADKTVIPEGFERFYTEKIAYLPNSYQVNDRERTISKSLFTKQELGLPEHGFIFCCFNNNYKILPETFDVWMRILKAVDGSVLWLFQDNTLVSKNLKKEAEMRGIDPNRLIFAERQPLQDHLARHMLADLFIDTWPCNAHTTASDALWAGLPILTLAGESFAGRVAASLLNAVGLPELITNSPQEYETLAIELANNPLKLNTLKQTLINHRLKSPLFDTPLYVNGIESLFEQMHSYNQESMPFDHIKNFEGKNQEC